MSYELTIIIPVFNEEGNLLRVENEFIEYFKTSHVPSQVLFVNDGSTDRSQQIIEDICSRNSSFQFISLVTNRGLSTAIKAGFDYVNTPLVGYIDADLQTSPQDFNVLLHYCRDYQLVNGVRINRKDSFIKTFSSKIANMIRRAFTGDGMDDTGCPLKVLHSDYAKRIPMFNGLHRFLPAMVLLQGGKVIQIPIQHFPRIAGKGKFGLWSRLFSPLLDCFAYLWMKKNYVRYNITKRSIQS